MKTPRPPRNTAGLNRGWRGPRDRREGRRQRLIRRLLIAADGEPVTTRDMIDVIYPRANRMEWRWRDVRASARRWAEPLLKPRSRPLRWRAKPGLLLSKQLAERADTPENDQK
jgi:hypothetical protein